MILKVWAKFNELDLECMCVENKCKDCGCGYDCSPYIVKFTPIEYELTKETKDLARSVKDKTKELDKLSKISKRLLR